MTAAVGPAASALRFGRSVWAWPIAGAALAAWPAWRSLVPEAPDFEFGPLRAQVGLATAIAILCGAWVARYRHRIAGFHLPLSVIGFAVIVCVMASAHGDTSVADLAALGISWLGATVLFAGAILLEGQRAFAAAQGGAVPPVSLLLRAHERLGYWLVGIALIAATIQKTPEGFLFAALAVVSPGAILSWAALCDTARATLARRKVQVGDLAGLPALTGYKSMVLGDRGILVGDRPKVTSILPAGDIKPGEIVALAAALLAEDDGDWARAVQDFGVTHRVRVPNLRSVESGAFAFRRGILPDRRAVEIGAVETCAIGDHELAPYAEPIARATELHRTVLAVVETEPARRLLGLLVLAKVARPGAAEAVRSLRKSGLALALANVDIAPQDRDALAGLGLDQAVTPGSTVRPAIGIVRPGGAPLELGFTVVRLGGPARTTQEREADILIEREDPRTLIDLLRFARDFRRRLPIAIAMSSLPGIALLSAVSRFVPASPLLITGVALAGIAVAVATPQVLRMSPTVANEVDEE
ncbi:MAG: hypothetical protein ACREEP_09520 [Dongiaceae bacterium]